MCLSPLTKSVTMTTDSSSTIIPAGRQPTSGAVPGNESPAICHHQYLTRTIVNKIHFPLTERLPLHLKIKVDIHVVSCGWPSGSKLRRLQTPKRACCLRKKCTETGRQVPIKVHISGDVKHPGVTQFECIRCLPYICIIFCHRKLTMLCLSNKLNGQQVPIKLATGPDCHNNEWSTSPELNTRLVTVASQSVSSRASKQSISQQSRLHNTL